MVDMGVSNHMCGKRNMFVEHDEPVGENVSFGDGSKILVEDKGKICWPKKLHSPFV